MNVTAQQLLTYILEQIDPLTLEKQYEVLDYLHFLIGELLIQREETTD